MLAGLAEAGSDLSHSGDKDKLSKRRVTLAVVASTKAIGREITRTRTEFLHTNDVLPGAEKLNERIVRPLRVAKLASTGVNEPSMTTVRANNLDRSSLPSVSTTISPLNICGDAEILNGKIALSPTVQAPVP